MYFTIMPVTRNQKKIRKAQKIASISKQDTPTVFFDVVKFERWCKLFHDMCQKMKNDPQLCLELYNACSRYDKLLSEAK